MNEGCKQALYVAFLQHKKMDISLKQIKIERKELAKKQTMQVLRLCREPVDCIIDLLG